MNRDRVRQIYDSTQRLHQNPEEFWAFLEVVMPHAPKRILEMGTAHGGTALVFQEMGAQVVSVDYRGITGEIPMEKFNQETTTFLHADTHDPSTLEKVRELMPEVDLLFIDGDHAYAGVKRDWEMYAPLVKPGGLVGFHDLAYGRNRDPESLIEAGKVFDEVKGERKTQEILIEHGIGVIWV